jgi:hypothetical protein
VTTVALAQGCAWSANTVPMDSLQTSFPVSASSKYLDANGNVIAPDQYQTVRSFQIHRTVKVKSAAPVVAPLELEEELDGLVTAAGGEAITNMTLQAQAYKAEGHYGANGWQALGWLGILIGGPTLGLSAMFDNGDHKHFNESGFYPWYGVGAGVLAMGLVSMAVASSRRAAQPNVWEIAIEGQIVRRKTMDSSAPPPPLDKQLAEAIFQPLAPNNRKALERTP